MKGIKEGTRSGLYYEGYKILKAKRPTYSIIENVKNLTSKRFKVQFNNILKDISDLGYTNYWQILNAKDYGIPQNRERVFIISIRNDCLSKNEFCFPQKIQLLWKLKDFLEDEVDEKYYLSEKAIGRLINKNNKLIKNMQNPELSSCLIAGYSKMDGKNNQYIIDNKVDKIAGIYDNGGKKHQAGSVYNPNGLSPTLTSMTHGGNKQPFILVRDGSKTGYKQANIGDSINISYHSNINKRGRVGKGVSQTILTSPTIVVLEKDNFNPKIAEKIMFNPYNNKKINDIAPAQTTACCSTTSSSAVLISEDGEQLIRIRKLTPLECWRLMGFDDEDFYKAKSVGISNTQLYKQAGNSIVVNVLEEIFKILL